MTYSDALRRPDRVRDLAEQHNIPDLCPRCLCPAGDHTLSPNAPTGTAPQVCPRLPLAAARRYAQAAAVLGSHEARPSGYCLCGERIAPGGTGAHLLLVMEEAGLRVVGG